MKSALPKPLHLVAGRSMLGHVIDAVTRAGASRLVVVVGPDRGDVADEATSLRPDAIVVEQAERLGTAHAVLMARTALAEGADDVVVAYADTPLVRPEIFAALRRPLADGAAVVALGFEASDATGYGRLITSGGALTAIREHRDASPAERAVTLCNAGLMAFRGETALDIIERIGNANSKGEYYLTDAVEVAVALGLTATFVAAPEADVQGVNDRAQLAQVEVAMQARLRAEAMANGATLVAPETVFLSSDTRLGRDVRIEPNVWFGPGVTVADDVTIRAFCHLEGATVASGSIVGPFARLRPGASLGERAHVGNFVEIKNATLGAGAKVNHLAYVGDASVGQGTNVGAGAVTCNYDGQRKHRTVIGERAFIGTNSALVAPVRIGDRAYVGSGSVITADVPDDALALGRGRQVVKEGWAADRADKATP